jgi:hypothetical protein
MYQRAILKERIFKDSLGCNIMDFDSMYLCTYLFISSPWFCLKLSVCRAVLYNFFFTSSVSRTLATPLYRGKNKCPQGNSIKTCKS